MLSKKTRISEIKGLFAETIEGKESAIKDLKFIVRQYDKGGQNKLGTGYSYLRAMDCFFYMILSKNEFKQYASIIRGKTVNEVKLNIAGYLKGKKPKDTKPELRDSISWDVLHSSFSSLSEEGDLRSFIVKLKEGCFDENSNGEVFWNKDCNTPLNLLLQEEGQKQKEYIICIIEQMCRIPINRYLTLETDPGNDGKNERVSWCRVERQYALFLYDLLLDKKNNRLTSRRAKEGTIRAGLYDRFNDIFGCSLDASFFVIDQVYYEVSVLRDLFDYMEDENKKELDMALLEFGLFGADDKPNVNKLIDIFLTMDRNSNGAKSIKGGTTKLWRSLCNLNNWEYTGISADMPFEKLVLSQRMYFACMMMNATPDIMVEYHYKRDIDIGGEILEANRRCAITLECKLESGVGPYDDYNGSGTINQELIQELIMTFLFGKRKLSWEIKPLEFYHPRRLTDQYEYWRKIYSFCNDILINYDKNGLFNEGIEDGEDRIINMGVREADFKKKENDNGVVFFAEDLTNAVYFNNNKYARPYIEN